MKTEQGTPTCALHANVGETREPHHVSSENENPSILGPKMLDLACLTLKYASFTLNLDTNKFVFLILVLFFFRKCQPLEKVI